MHLTWPFLVLNTVSILGNSFCCACLLFLLHTLPSLRNHETVLHVWLVASVLFGCVFVAALEVVYDAVHGDASMHYCVILDSMRSGSLTLLTSLLFLQSSLRCVMTFRPHTVPSDRVLVVACLLPTVGISTVFACWAWKRTEHLSSCRDIPFDVFRRFPFLVASISVEISLVLTLVLAYTLLYLGVFKSRRKALNGNLTFAQFIRCERQGLATVLTLLSFFVLIRSPYFAVKLMFVTGVEVHVETYRVCRILTRCSCVVIPLSTLLSRRVRPGFRSEQARPRLKGSLASGQNKPGLA